jgi:hypothetical protein
LGYEQVELGPLKGFPDDTAAYVLRPENDR